MKDHVTALYLRLSLSDGDLGKNGKDESNSIENQRTLLLDYIRKAEGISAITKEYVDDGYTGTNFERPGFKKMIEDAKNGIIDTIMVKDLSRLGRDYIYVGDYVEQVFPVLGIRFISVSNNFDSNRYMGTTMGLEMALNSLINTFYSRDISKKIKSSMETKWKNGIATNFQTPFGYIYAGNGKWEIDEPAAKIVRLIFEECIKGHDTASIVNKLNAMNVPTPGTFCEKSDPRWKIRHITEEKNRFWNRQMVWRILNHYEYTGALVTRKRMKIRVGSSATVKTDKERQIVCENAHKAIISHEMFEEAQSHRKKRNRGALFDRKYALKGLVRCGVCKRLMIYNAGSYNNMFRCVNAEEGISRYSHCYKESVQENILEAKVAYAIRKMVQMAASVSEKLESDAPKTMDVITPDLEKLKSEIEILQAERIRQYEAYADGVITKEVFQTKKDKIGEAIREKQNKIDEVTGILEEADEIRSGIEKISEEGDRLVTDRGLTREMAEAFIDRIYVYDKDRIEVVFKSEDILNKALGRCG